MKYDIIGKRKGEFTPKDKKEVVCYYRVYLAEPCGEHGYGLKVLEYPISSKLYDSLPNDEESYKKGGLESDVYFNMYGKIEEILF